MNDAIYGYAYEFVYRGGHYIEVADRKLQAEHICKLELNMLEHNAVPFLLPLTIEDIDFSLKLLYPLSGMRRLSEQLRIAPPDLGQYYRLLHQIALALEQAADYMLTENHFVLNLPFVFVRPGYETVGLLYLPLKRVDKPGWQEEMSALTVAMLAHVSQVSGAGVPSIIRMLEQPSCSLPQLIKLLERLQQEEGAYPVTGLHTEQSADHAEPHVDFRSERHTAQTERHSTQTERHMDQAETESTPEPHRWTFSYADRSLSSYLFGGLALVIVAALLTRVYIAFPGEGMLYMTIGLMMLAVDGAFVYVMLNRSTKREPEFDPMLDGWEAIDDEDAESGAYRWQKLGDDIIMTPGEKLDQFEEQEEQELGQTLLSPHDDYYRSLSEHTTLLQKSDATTLLSPSNSDNQNPTVPEDDKVIMEISPRVIRAYLEWPSDTGSSVPFQIEITEQRSVIGRDSHYADIAYNRPGVSRAHAELVREDDRFYLTDLGSINGTFINDVPAAAYKKYPLQNGDRIRFADNEVVFRIVG